VAGEVDVCLAYPGSFCLRWALAISDESGPKPRVGRVRGGRMEEQSVVAEHRERVAAYAALLPDIAAVQAHGQHAFVAACLTALARLRVADAVDGQRGLEEIAAIGQVDPLALRRMVRFLEPHGFFERIDGRVSLTGKGRLLRSDSPIWSSFFLRGANDAAWHLDHSLKTGGAAFPRE